MERALALLAKRSDGAKVGVGGSSSREVSSKRRDAGSMKNTEKHGDEVELVGSGPIENVGLRERKRIRDRENEDEAPRRVAGKSNVGAGVDLPPIVQPPKVASSVRVEVSPNQRWTFGSSAPIQVFQVFNLPQDVNSYVNKSRAEIAERCLTRGGRFFADLMHIVNAYKANIDLKGNERLSQELAEAKAARSEAEMKVLESAKREAEATRRNFEAKTKLSEENDRLKGNLTSLEGEMKASKIAIEVEAKKVADVEIELIREKGEVAKLKEENAGLKVDLEKSVTDIANALGVGYGYCYDRVIAAGIDLSGHSFDDYCSDLAKRMQESAVGEKAGEKAVDQV